MGDAMESGKRRSLISVFLVSLAIGCGVVGVGIRLANWWWHPGFWQDEAGLALNVVGRDFSELGSPFLYYQACGWAFLAAAKVIIGVLGPMSTFFDSYPWSRSWSFRC